MPVGQEAGYPFFTNLTIEETYELTDSIIQEDWNGIGEELGDLLLHIVVLCKVGKRERCF
jgi:XTP/dITP diphosphohydrolase